MSYVLEKEGLSDQIISWLRKIEIMPDQTHKIRMHIVNGALIKGTSEIIKQKNEFISHINVDILPILNRLKRSLQRFDPLYGEIEIAISTNAEGLIVDGDILIRSGQLQ